jgi:hypothetical protein
MDSVETYIQCVKQLLNDYGSIPISNEPDVHNEVIFDTEHNRYLLLSVGWSKGKRVHHTVMHIDIIDEQIWIQANNSSTGSNCLRFTTARCSSLHGLWCTS